MPSAMSEPIPATLDELSVQWLNEALASGGVVTTPVSAIEVEPLGASVGLIGDLARVRLSYEHATDDRAAAGADQPETVIIKVPAQDPGGRQVGTMLHAYAREVAFYREVSGAAPGIQTPACYYAGGDPSADLWIVVLEDCPGDPVDPITGASLEQATAVVGALASFHGAWWQSPAAFAWMPGFDANGVGGLQAPWQDAHPVFLERFGHLIPDGTADWLIRFAPTLSDWSRAVAAEPLTIVHTDVRLDNLIFDGSRVTMIDWQTALRGPAAMDLTCFLATSLTIDARRTSEPALIDQYLTALEDQGIVADREWFIRSYDENLLWWMGQFANNLARIEPPDQATQRSIELMIERTFTAAADRGVGRLLG